MVLFNYSTRELTAKIVYYGPGLCGKTTNLQYVHSTLPEDVKGKMLSLATKTDRTLFFDFLPIDLGEIRGMKTRIQLYTVPGQVFYNETRKLVLKGADGIVFVADSQAAMLGANVESFRNLEENLKAHGLKLSEMPHAIQFNKRDLPKLSTIEELNSAVNRYNAPFYESVAVTGIGVQDTLKAITKLVLLHLTRKYDPKATPERPAAAAPVPVPAAAQASAQTTAHTVRQRPTTTGAPTAATRSIPLSDVRDPLAGATSERPRAPRAAAPQARARREDDAMFGPQEIDSLVSEVHESDPPIDLGVSDALSVSDSDVDRLDESFDLGEPEPVVAAPARGAVDAPVDVPASDGMAFEIDHRFDPDTERPARAARAARPAPPARPQPAAAPPVPEPIEAEPDPVWDLGAVEEPQIAAPEPTPLREERTPLIEPVSGTDLFDDPSIEVARMSAGEQREILIPVEIDGRVGTKRFTLSIRLRLDPVD